jgi:hypothetical protein
VLTEFFLPSRRVKKIHTWEWGKILSQLSSTFFFKQMGSRWWNQLQHPKYINKKRGNKYKERRGTNTKTFSSKKAKQTKIGG